MRSHNYQYTNSHAHTHTHTHAHTRTHTHTHTHTHMHAHTRVLEQQIWLTTFIPWKSIARPTVYIDEGLPSLYPHTPHARANTHTLVHAHLAAPGTPGGRNANNTRTRVGVDVLFSVIDLETAGLGVVGRPGGSATCHGKQERDDHKARLHNISEKESASLVTLSKGRAREINRVSCGFRTCSQK